MQINSHSGVRPYSQLDVCLTYQNQGSTWLCILRGSTENIERVFNGLFNWCATNGGLKYFDHANTVATFWSDRRALRRFFFNQFFFPRSDGRQGTNQRTLVRNAMRYAHKQIALLRATGHEFLVDFSEQFMPQVHGVGTISAERPDSDFKDSVMNYAFADKN